MAAPGLAPCSRITPTNRSGHDILAPAVKSIYSPNTQDHIKFLALDQRHCYAY